MTLFKRARTHCSTAELRQKEEANLYKVFLRNGYPKNFIHRTLKKAENHRNTNTRGDTTNGQQAQMKTVTIPYIKTISEMTARLLRPQGIRVAHKPVATIRTLTSKPKTPIDPSEKHNVIYMVPCNDCPKRYVGQTGRKLSTSLHEHQLAIRRHDNCHLCLHTKI